MIKSRFVATKTDFFNRQCDTFVCIFLNMSALGDNKIMTRETGQAVERRPGQILERHDLAEDSTRQGNLETGHYGCPMMMMMMSQIISPKTSTYNLGLVFFNNNFNFVQHISNTYRSWFRTRDRRRICQHLSRSVTRNVDTAFFTSKLDYCTAIPSFSMLSIWVVRGRSQYVLSTLNVTY